MKNFTRKVISYIVFIAMTFTIISSSNISALAYSSYDNKKAEVKFFTSFEKGADRDGFLSSTLEGDKSSNVNGYLRGGLSGDITDKVKLDSIQGSSDFKSSEGKLNLFDKSRSTKFLTEDARPVKVSFEIEKEEIVKTYAITSANDANRRDPKAWELQGSNDRNTWTKLHSTNNVIFNERFEQKMYEIDNETAYKYYQIVITENNGESMTQFAELTLATGGIEEDKEKDRMTTEIVSGPDYTWNTQGNMGWTGASSLEMSGNHLTEGEGYGYNAIYENLAIPVDENTNLSYVIFPAEVNGDYDFDYTSMYTAVDLKFSDGTYLSELGSIDQNGNIVSPEEQGKSRTLTSTQWNEIKTNIGQVANGKTIEKIIVGYHKGDNTKGVAAKFSAFIDDIKLYDKEVKVEENLSDYVNILRGTNNNTSFSRGLTAPAVTTPHGFNFWVPVTNSNNNLTYEYQLNGNKNTLKHITTSHEPSYWIGDRGTWQFMINTSIDPSSVNSGSKINANARAAEFKHENETAKAHYYGVTFDEGSKASNAKMEVTPTEHGAISRFTFPSDAANRNVILDCERASGGLTFNPEDNSFTAYSDHASNGMKRMYVYGKFNVPYETSNVQNSKQGIVSFPIGTTSVEMKIATSFLSAEQAKKNLELEISDNENFNDIFKQAQGIWDDKLDVIEVEGATREQLVTLYSNLYRLFAYPNIMSENVGTAKEPVWKYASPYRGSVQNPEAVEGKIYVNNGFWDTYRTTWAAYTLLSPEKNTEMLDGLVQHYDDQGWVPRWIAPGGTNSMVGTSSDIIFGDAITKDVEFNYENAFKSALKNASVVSNNLTNGGRERVQTSVFDGYVPAEQGEGFSWAMEGYLNDYGIYKMAEKLDKKDEAIYYKNRSLNYTKLFSDYNGGWFRGKLLNGQWRTSDAAFDPIRWGSDYTETNAWNMAFSVVHDGQGLANLYGGRDKLGNKLDEFFTTDGNFNPGGYGGVIHEMLEAREIKLGQYGHSNQPSHHIPYMYNYAAQPWKTQAIVRDVLDRAYVGSEFGQGYIGDEDNGEMSAWYIFSALGFYPVTVGNDEYAIGSPLFKKATIHLENGKDIVINAPNNSKDNVYIQSMTLNGEEYSKNYIKHEDIKNGADITFNLGEAPNKDWGSSEEALLSSITEGNEVAKPMDDFTKKDVSVSGEAPVIVDKDTAFSPEGDVSRLFNNNSGDEVKASTVYYTFAEPKYVELYTLTSSRNNKNDAPKNFTLSASNDGNEWVILDARTNETFEWAQYTRPFAIDSDKINKYTHYKLEMSGGDKLSEMELIGYSNKKVMYPISIEEVKNGVITSDAIDNKILEGNNVVFTFAPEEGYVIKSAMINDVDITSELVDNKYTVTNVQGNITVTAEFEKIIISKIKDLKIKNATNSNVELIWEEPSNTTGLIGYVIYKDGKLFTEVDKNINTYNVEELKSNTIYGFKVTAKYLNGIESKPKSINVRTLK